MHTTTTLSFKTLLHTALITILLGPINLLPGFFGGSGGSSHNLAAAGLPMPISLKACTNDHFDPVDGKAVIEALVETFGPGEQEDMDKPLRRHGVHAETSGTAMAFLCQCHGCKPGYFPESEIREVYTILVDEDCGPGRGGWLWSRQWNKGFGIGSTRRLGGPDTGPRVLCPRRCMSKNYEGRFACDSFSNGASAIGKRGEEDIPGIGDGDGNGNGNGNGTGIEDLWEIDSSVDADY